MWQIWHSTSSPQVTASKHSKYDWDTLIPAVLVATYYRNIKYLRQCRSGSVRTVTEQASLELLFTASSSCVHFSFSDANIAQFYMTTVETSSLALSFEIKPW